MLTKADGKIHSSVPFSFFGQRNLALIFDHNVYDRTRFMYAMCRSIHDRTRFNNNRIDA